MLFHGWEVPYLYVTYNHRNEVVCVWQEELGL